MCTNCHEIQRLSRLGRMTVHWKNQKDLWVDACVDIIKATLKAHGKEKVIALSGGSTPIEVYAKLGEFLSSSEEDEVARVKFFVVDERDVDLCSSRSNSKMISLYLGKWLHGFSPKVESAESYNENFQEAIRQSGGLDLVVLGCGEDGHVASLFPGSQLVDSNDDKFAANLLVTGEVRYTMTFPMLLRARKRLVLIKNNTEKEKFFGRCSAPRSVLPIHKILDSDNTDVIICHEV